MFISRSTEDTATTDPEPGQWQLQDIHPDQQLHCRDIQRVLNYWESSWWGVGDAGRLQEWLCWVPGEMSGDVLIYFCIQPWLQLMNIHDS